MPTPELLDPNKEHTLVLVKPDGFARGLTGEVLRRIEAKGYVLKGLKSSGPRKNCLRSTTRSTAISTSSPACSSS